MPASFGESKPACLVCRQRKVACDRKRPKCGLCTKQNFECEYRSREARPGLRAGYVSRLEQQLKAVEQRLRRVEAHIAVDEQSPRGQVYPAESSPTLAEHSPTSVGDRGTDGPSEPQTTPSYMAQSDMGLQATVSYAITGSVLERSEDLIEPLIRKSLKTWFMKYHAFFPILHKASLERDVSAVAPRYYYVCRSITAVATLNDGYASAEETQQAERFREEVMCYGIVTASLQSLQALLILSNHYYSEGSLTQFWNVLAMCKRMSMRLDLGSLTTVARWSSMARFPQPLRAIASSPIEQEEAVRVFWMIEMLDSISTIGLSSCLSSLEMPVSASLPCSESLWALREPVIDRFISSQVQYSSMFSLCIILAMEELGVIHRFLKRPINRESTEDRQNWQTEAQQLDERLTNWREEFVAAMFRLISSEKSHVPLGEMEPLVTLANCVLNSAIIVLMQQMAPFPTSIERDCEPWPFATARCVYACENMAAKVKRIEANQIDCQSPQLIYCVFAAARFYVVYSKALEADVPANLRSLAFFLHSSGKSSPLAKGYEQIIRAAVGEHRSPMPQCVLPIEFYDLRYSTLDIAELLQETAERLGSRNKGVNAETADGRRWSEALATYQVSP